MQNATNETVRTAFLQGLKESPRVFFAPLAPATWRRYRALRVEGMGRWASLETALDLTGTPLAREQDRN